MRKSLHRWQPLFDTSNYVFAEYLHINVQRIVEDVVMHDDAVTTRL